MHYWCQATSEQFLNKVAELVRFQCFVSLIGNWKETFL